MASVEQGFRSVKMRLGRPTVAEDIARVDAMRNHLPDDIEMMVDANEAWRVDQTARAMTLLEPFDLVWLEEPIAPDNTAGYAHLRALGKVPLAVGENHHTLAEFATLIGAGGVDFPEPDLTTCGGITPFMKIAHLAEAHGLPVTSHGVHDLHIHLLAAARTRRTWSGMPSARQVHGGTADREGRLCARTGPAGPRHHVRLAGARRPPAVALYRLERGRLIPDYPAYPGLDRLWAWRGRCAMGDSERGNVKEGWSAWWSFARIPEFPVEAEKTALIVIDMTYQQAHRDYGLCKRITRGGAGGRLAYYLDRIDRVVVPNLVELIAAFREVGAPVIYTRCARWWATAPTRPGVTATSAWSRPSTRRTRRFSRH